MNNETALLTLIVIGTISLVVSIAFLAAKGGVFMQDKPSDNVTRLGALDVRQSTFAELELLPGEDKETVTKTLSDGSKLTKRNNRSWTIAKGNTVFNITSTADIHEVGDIAETREWEYKNIRKLEIETVKSNYSMFLHDENTLCTNNPIIKKIESNSWKPRQYEYSCIYYPPSINRSKIYIINSKEYKINITGNYDPVIVSVFTSNECDSNTCNNVAFNGRAIQLMGNETVNFLVPFEGGVYDVGQYDYNLTGYSSGFVDGYDTGTKAYDAKKTSSSNIVVKDDFNFNNRNITFLNKFNFTDSGDSRFEMIFVGDGTDNQDIRNGFDSLKFDDSSSMRLGYADSSSVNGEVTSSFVLGTGGWYNLGWSSLCRDGAATGDLYYYKGIGNNSWNSDLIGLNCDDFGGYTGEWYLLSRPDGNDAFDGGIQFMQLLDTYVNDDTYVSCSNSKYGCFLEQRGNITINFTIGSTNNRANLSFTCFGADDPQADCWASIDGNTWYDTNQTDITLTSGTNRNVTVIINSTNHTKTPLLNEIRLETWNVAVGGDSCSPTSPLSADHVFLGSDNCVVTSDLEADGNDVSCSGDGTLTLINAQITNYGSLDTHGGCDITCWHSDGCF